MTFFYNLNKKLDEIRATPETTHKQLNERDEGKPGKMFAKISADAAKRYGSKEAGDRVAGKIRADKAKAGTLDEGAAAGYAPEMHEKIKNATPQELSDMAYDFGGDALRAQHELKLLKQAQAELRGQMQEGFVDTVKSGAQAALQAIGNTLGHGSDEDMIRDLQKKAGVPVTGKVPPQQPGQNPTTAGQKPMAEEVAAGSAAAKFNPSMHARIKNASQDELSDIATSFAGDGFGSQNKWDDEYKLLVAAQQELLGGASAQRQLWANQRSQGIQSRLNQTLKSKYPNMKVSEADIEEGPEVFKLKADAARKAGQKEFKGPDGKTYPVKEGKGAKPDYIDLDKDGNRKESMKKAAADKKKHEHEELDEGWDDMLKDVERRREKKTGEVERGHKHDIKHTATGRVVTRRTDDRGISVGADDDEKPTGEKRDPGRPKKTDKAPERVTAKAYKHKGGRKSVDEGSDYNQAQQIYNDLADIRAVAKQAQRGGQFPQGFASRLESALWAVMTLLKNQQPADAQVRERKLSSSEKEEREDIVKGMKKNKGEFKKRYGKRGEEVMYATATKMAKERGPGNPDRKKKEKTEETTVAGSVAPAAGGKSKGNSLIGKGIYDSLNRELEGMIAESMNVSVNMTTDDTGTPRKNITVSAEGDAAEQLAQLLNLAGMAGQSSEHGGCGCDTDPCSCEEMVDENAPDWPTDTEVTGDDDPHMTRWAGGLNKPKETGQTTAPVVNRDPARGSYGPPEVKHDVNESTDLGMNLYRELKNFKVK